MMSWNWPPLPSFTGSRRTTFSVSQFGYSGGIHDARPTAKRLANTPKIVLPTIMFQPVFRVFTILA